MKDRFETEWRASPVHMNDGQSYRLTRDEKGEAWLECCCEYVEDGSVDEEYIVSVSTSAFTDDEAWVFVSELQSIFPLVSKVDLIKCMRG